MIKTMALFAALAIGVPTLTAAPVLASPLDIARDAAHLGLNTAKKAVDLGLDTAEGAADIAVDAVTPDNCNEGQRYRDNNGNWHTCARR